MSFTYIKINLPDFFDGFFFLVAKSAKCSEKKIL